MAARLSTDAGLKNKLIQGFLTTNIALIKVSFTDFKLFVTPLILCIDMQLEGFLMIRVTVQAAKVGRFYWFFFCFFFFDAVILIKMHGHNYKQYRRKLVAFDWYF